jgi:PAS domain S-box-containing protein
MHKDPFRLLADNATDYAMFTTDRMGRVEAWSPGAERILGFAEQEIRGRSADVLFVPEDRDAGIPDLERSLALGAGRAENERWHLRKGGSRFWGAGIMVPLLGPDRQHLGFAKVLRDFTRRRELESAHIDAQRLEGVGLFAGGVAHLFNNLLTVSLGNLELLLRLPEVRNSPEVQELGRSIRRAEQRMAELTQQVLAFAGKARGRMSPVDPCAVVRDALAALGPDIPASVNVVAGLPDACASVVGDQVLLRQLVMSLLVNAVEAIGDRPRGSIFLSVEDTEIAAEAARSSYAGFELMPGSYVRLQCSDSGPGLDPEAQAHLFDPFYTTKFQGRGLGLAAALGITRMHGGAINARSGPDSGTTIDVVLPVSGKAMPREEPARRMALVVDDEELVRSLTSKILEALGYTVVQAENGKQAVEIAQRLTEQLGLVVLDLAMPGQDGAATVPPLRERLPEAGIILMTGVVSPDIEGEPWSKHRVVELRKPFTFDQLAQAVETATAREHAMSGATSDRPPGS